MYLQVTTKCNMACAHCGFACGRKGEHMPFRTAIAAVCFINNWGKEVIAIGGGEPTMNPRFFDILRLCLDSFDRVWLSTNGKKTRTMRRLADIMLDRDWQNDRSEDGSDRIPNPDRRLAVDLSLDRFHSPINPEIVQLWREKASASRFWTHNPFKIRDVSGYVIPVGRAKNNGLGDQVASDRCVCNDIIIKPSGTIQLCGCPGSPDIGDVWNGVDPDWETVIRQDDGYETYHCYRKVTLTAGGESLSPDIAA